MIPMSWHCEDAAVTYSNVPAVSNAWHEIIAGLRRTSDVFDDWGMFAYTSASTGVDYLTEIDVGIWEQRLDDARVRAAWVQAKRDIAAAAIAHGGLDQRLPRLLPRGRGGPRARGTRPRVRRDARRQARPGPEQHHEPRQVPAGPWGVRGGLLMPAEDAPPMPTDQAPPGPRAAAPYRFAEQHTARPRRG